MAGNKYIANSSGTLTEVAASQTSAGAGDAGKVVALNSAGAVDVTMMPAGVGIDTATIVASEALSAGNFVNVWNNSGTANVRKADATTSGKEAHGFVLSSVSSSANAVVYFPGSANNSVSGLTPGVIFLSTTAGGATGTPPSSSGNVVQRLGQATSATNAVFLPSEPIVLA